MLHRLKQHILCVVITVVLLSHTGVCAWWGDDADAVPPEDYPNPMINPEACGNSVKSWVCDPSGYVRGHQGRIQTILNAIRANTTVTCDDGTQNGFQVAIALTKKMPSSWGPRDEEAKAAKYAEKLGDLWGVGDPGCYNGIVLFLSIEDRAIYVRTAKEAGRRVTSPEIQIIIERMRPYLRHKQYPDAIEGACLVMLEELQRPIRSWWQRLLTINNVVLAAIFCFMFFMTGWWRLAVAAVYFAVALPILGVLWCGAWCVDKCRGCCRGKEEQEAQMALDRVAAELARPPEPAADASAPPLDSSGAAATAPPPPTTGDDSMPAGKVPGLPKEPSAPDAAVAFPAPPPLPCPICLDSLFASDNPLGDQPDSDLTNPSATLPASQQRLLIEQANVHQRPLRRLPCRHEFHRDCLQGWFDQSLQHTCPLCRAESGEDDDTLPSPIRGEGDETEEAARYRRRVEFFMRRLTQRYPRVFRRHANTYRRAFLDNAPSFPGRPCVATYQPRPRFIYVPRIAQVNQVLPLPTFEQFFSPMRTFVAPATTSTNTAGSAAAENTSRGGFVRSRGNFGGGGGFSSGFGGGGGGGRW